MIIVTTTAPEKTASPGCELGSIPRCAGSSGAPMPASTSMWFTPARRMVAAHRQSGGPGRRRAGARQGGRAGFFVVMPWPPPRPWPPPISTAHDLHPGAADM